MTYRVDFPTAVVYQPSHPKARRSITSLVVHAATPEAAAIHAIRVVEGMVEGWTVTPLDGPLGPLPLVEHAPDPPPVRIIAS